MSDEFDPFDSAEANNEEPQSENQQNNNIDNEENENENENNTKQDPSEDAFTGSSSQPVDFVASPQSKTDSVNMDDPFASVDNQQAENKFSSFNNVSDGKQEEDSALNVWEKERSAILRERGLKEDNDKQQLLQQAKADLDKFYAESAAKLLKNQKTNRADEKNFKQDMRTTFENGSRWEKVNKLVNVTQSAKSNDKSSSVTTSRVDRFKKLLIQMKSVKDKDDRKH